MIAFPNVSTVCYLHTHRRGPHPSSETYYWCEVHRCESTTLSGRCPMGELSYCLFQAVEEIVTLRTAVHKHRAIVDDLPPIIEVLRKLNESNNE